MNYHRLKSLTFSALAFAPVAGALGQSNPAPATAPSAPVTLSQFEVVADQDRGYASTNAVGGTRFNTAIVNLPQSVVVLNEEFLRDLGALSVIDAAQYVSGVSSTAGPGREVFNVRGYQVDVTTDGLPDSSPTAQGLSTPFELVERVEIIKGPAAVLYGSTSPGGNVNRLTKKPLFRDQTQLLASIGDGEYYRGVFDVNRSTNVGSGLAVRVIGSNEHAGWMHNFEDSDSWFISPMVGWRITPKTTLVVTPYLLERSYHKKFATLFQFRPFNRTGAISFNLPRDVDWGGKYARESFDVKRLYSQLDHQITDNWSLRLSAIGKDHDETNNDIIPRDLLPDNRTMQRTWRIIRTEGKYRIGALDSLVSYDIGATKNKTLFVAQYSKTKTDANIETGRKLSGQNTTAGENADSSFSNLPLIDVFNPDPVRLNARPDTTFISSNTRAEGEVYAFSLQHQIEMLEGRLVANAGVRYDHTESLGQNRLTNRVTSSGTNSHYTKRAGAVYKPIPGLAAFYNYSETFSPIFSVNPDGTGFDPTEGVTHEGGIKSDLLSGRISGTASLFTIENQNLLVIDPDPLRASAGFRTQSAKDVLDGFELDLHFNVVKGLQLMTAYSKLKSKTNNGLRVRNVPDETWSAFASYDFRRNDVGFTAGAGVRHKGEHPGDAANAFFLAGATVWDAFATYRFNRQLHFQLNVNNVFDKYYADSSINRNLIFAGPERRIRFTTTYTF